MKILDDKARDIRIQLLNMIYEGKTGHTGGALSSVDILVALYYKIMNLAPENPKWEDRDRFVLSKGHSVEGLLCILADKGFFDKDILHSFSQYGSLLIGHPNNRVPGIEICSGALGHGLSIGVGMALGAKKAKKSFRAFVLLGDGEQSEGSVWEAAMAGSHYKLDNLYAFTDRNHLQISGNTEDIMALENLAEKWSAFGWEVTEIDGHNIDQIINTIENVSGNTDKPHMIIANTIKGKGVSFMENRVKWHHGVPTKEQLEMAINELGGTQNEGAM